MHNLSASGASIYDFKLIITKIVMPLFCEVFVDVINFGCGLQYTIICKPKVSALTIPL